MSNEMLDWLRERELERSPRLNLELKELQKQTWALREENDRLREGMRRIVDMAANHRPLEELEMVEQQALGKGVKP